MGKRLTNRQSFNQTNLQDVPDQSGIYLIRNRKGDCQYVGSAGAGRLAERLKEHLSQLASNTSAVLNFASLLITLPGISLSLL